MEKKALLRGTSFACAYFCGMYGKYLFNGGERDVHHYIQTFSKRIIECNHTKEISGPVFKIKKAIIFPVNKEAHAILRMKAELEFSIVGAFDDKLSGNGGTDFWGIPVQPFDLIDWDDDFDTVILSCIVDFERIIGKNYTKMIIDNCKKHSKQLYTFENIIADFRNDEDALNMSKYSKIYYPEVNSSMTPYYKFNKLNRLSIPVLGVFGTAPKQGKFTLQLGLLKSLKKRMYKVGFLATEPSGYLLSADYTFHFGYNANTNLSQREIIAILNECLFKIQLSGADIIVTGCQSATTHYDNANISHFCIEQYSFLLATTPDFCILCINAYDEIDYIERTISCIQSVGDGKVLAIVLFPKDILSTSTNIVYTTKTLNCHELSKRKKYFSDILSLPVYYIDIEEDMSNLCNQIIDYFSDEDL